MFLDINITLPVKLNKEYRVEDLDKIVFYNLNSLEQNNFKYSVNDLSFNNFPREAKINDVLANFKTNVIKVTYSDTKELGINKELNDLTQVRANRSKYNQLYRDLEKENLELDILRKKEILELRERMIALENEVERSRSTSFGCYNNNKNISNNNIRVLGNNRYEREFNNSINNNKNHTNINNEVLVYHVNECFDTNDIEERNIAYSEDKYHFNNSNANTISNTYYKNINQDFDNINFQTYYDNSKVPSYSQNKYTTSKPNYAITDKMKETNYSSLYNPNANTNINMNNISSINTKTKLYHLNKANNNVGINEYNVRALNYQREYDNSFYNMNNTNKLQQEGLDNNLNKDNSLNNSNNEIYEEQKDMNKEFSLCRQKMQKLKESLLKNGFSNSDLSSREDKDMKYSNGLNNYKVEVKDNTNITSTKESKDLGNKNAQKQSNDSKEKHYFRIPLFKKKTIKLNIDKNNEFSIKEPSTKANNINTSNTNKYNDLNKRGNTINDNNNISNSSNSLLQNDNFGFSINKKEDNYRENQRYIALQTTESLQIINLIKDNIINKDTNDNNQDINKRKIKCKDSFTNTNTTTHDLLITNIKDIRELLMTNNNSLNKITKISEIEINPFVIFQNTNDNGENNNGTSTKTKENNLILNDNSVIARQANIEIVSSVNDFHSSSNNNNNNINNINDKTLDINEINIEKELIVRLLEENKQLKLENQELQYICDLLRSKIPELNYEFLEITQESELSIISKTLLKNNSTSNNNNNYNLANYGYTSFENSSRHCSTYRFRESVIDGKYKTLKPKNDICENTDNDEDESENCSDNNGSESQEENEDDHSNSNIDSEAEDSNDINDLKEEINENNEINNNRNSSTIKNDSNNSNYSNIKFFSSLKKNNTSNGENRKIVFITDNDRSSRQNDINKDINKDVYRNKQDKNNSDNNNAEITVFNTNTSNTNNTNNTNENDIIKQLDDKDDEHDKERKELNNYQEELSIHKKNSKEDYDSKPKYLRPLSLMSFNEQEQEYPKISITNSENNDNNTIYKENTNPNEPLFTGADRTNKSTKTLRTKTNKSKKTIKSVKTIKTTKTNKSKKHKDDIRDKIITLQFNEEFLSSQNFNFLIPLKQVTTPTNNNLVHLKFRNSYKDSMRNSLYNDDIDDHEFELNNEDKKTSSSNKALNGNFTFNESVDLSTQRQLIKHFSNKKEEENIITSNNNNNYDENNNKEFNVEIESKVLDTENYSEDNITYRTCQSNSPSISNHSIKNKENTRTEKNSSKIREKNNQQKKEYENSNENEGIKKKFSLSNIDINRVNDDEEEVMYSSRRFVIDSNTSRGLGKNDKEKNEHCIKMKEIGKSGKTNDNETKSEYLEEFEEHITIKPSIVSKNYYYKPVVLTKQLNKYTNRDENENNKENNYSNRVSKPMIIKDNANFNNNINSSSSNKDTKIAFTKCNNSNDTSGSISNIDIHLEDTYMNTNLIKPTTFNQAIDTICFNNYSNTDNNYRDDNNNIRKNYSSNNDTEESNIEIIAHQKYNIKRNYIKKLSGYNNNISNSDSNNNISNNSINEHKPLYNNTINNNDSDNKNSNLTTKYTEALGHNLPSNKTKELNKLNNKNAHNTAILSIHKEEVEIYSTKEDPKNNKIKGSLNMEISETMFNIISKSSPTKLNSNMNIEKQQSELLSINNQQFPNSSGIPNNSKTIVSNYSIEYLKERKEEASKLSISKQETFDFNHVSIKNNYSPYKLDKSENENTIINDQNFHLLTMNTLSDNSEIGYNSKTNQTNQNVTNNTNNQNNQNNQNKCTSCFKSSHKKAKSKLIYNAKKSNINSQYAINMRKNRFKNNCNEGDSKSDKKKFLSENKEDTAFQYSKKSNHRDNSDIDNSVSPIHKEIDNKEFKVDYYDNTITIENDITTFRNKDNSIQERIFEQNNRRRNSNNNNNNNNCNNTIDNNQTYINIENTQTTNYNKTNVKNIDDTRKKNFNGQFDTISKENNSEYLSNNNQIKYNISNDTLNSNNNTNKFNTNEFDISTNNIEIMSNDYNSSKMNIKSRIKIKPMSISKNKLHIREMYVDDNTQNTNNKYINSSNLDYLVVNSNTKKRNLSFNQQQGDENRNDKLQIEKMYNSNLNNNINSEDTELGTGHFNQDLLYNNNSNSNINSIMNNDQIKSNLFYSFNKEDCFAISSNIENEDTNSKMINNDNINTHVINKVLCITTPVEIKYEDKYDNKKINSKLNRTNTNTDIHNSKMNRISNAIIKSQSVNNISNLSQENSNEDSNDYTRNINIEKTNLNNNLNNNHNRGNEIRTYSKTKLTNKNLIKYAVNNSKHNKNNNNNEDDTISVEQQVASHSLNTLEKNNHKLNYENNSKINISSNNSKNSENMKCTVNMKSLNNKKFSIPIPIQSNLLNTDSAVPKSSNNCSSKEMLLLSNTINNNKHQYSEDFNLKIEDISNNISKYNLNHENTENYENNDYNNTNDLNNASDSNTYYINSMISDKQSNNKLKLFNSHFSNISSSNTLISNSKIGIPKINMKINTKKYTTVIPSIIMSERTHRESRDNSKLIHEDKEESDKYNTISNCNSNDFNKKRNDRNKNPYSNINYEYNYLNNREDNNDDNNKFDDSNDIRDFKAREDSMVKKDMKEMKRYINNKEDSVNNDKKSHKIKDNSEQDKINDNENTNKSNNTINNNTTSIDNKDNYNEYYCRNNLSLGFFNDKKSLITSKTKTKNSCNSIKKEFFFIDSEKPLVFDNVFSGKFNNKRDYLKQHPELKNIIDKKFHKEDDNASKSNLDNKLSKLDTEDININNYNNTNKIDYNENNIIKESIKCSQSSFLPKTIQQDKQKYEEVFYNNSLQTTQINHIPDLNQIVETNQTMILQSNTKTKTTETIKTIETKELAAETNKLNIISIDNQEPLNIIQTTQNKNLHNKLLNNINLKETLLQIYNSRHIIEYSLKKSKALITKLEDYNNFEENYTENTCSVNTDKGFFIVTGERFNLLYYYNKIYFNNRIIKVNTLKENHFGGSLMYLPSLQKLLCLGGKFTLESEFLDLSNYNMKRINALNAKWQYLPKMRIKTESLIPISLNLSFNNEKLYVFKSCKASVICVESIEITKFFNEYYEYNNVRNSENESYKRKNSHFINYDSNDKENNANYNFINNNNTIDQTDLNSNISNINPSLNETIISAHSCNIYSKRTIKDIKGIKNNIISTVTNDPHSKTKSSNNVIPKFESSIKWETINLNITGFSIFTILKNHYSNEILILGKESFLIFDMNIKFISSENYNISEFLYKTDFDKDFDTKSGISRISRISRLSKGNKDKERSKSKNSIVINNSCFNSLTSFNKIYSGNEYEVFLDEEYNSYYLNESLFIQEKFKI